MNAVRGRVRGGRIELDGALPEGAEVVVLANGLVDRAARGEEIVIAKNGVPVAKLVALSKTTARRKPGGWNGKVWIADDFDAPLPDETLALFEKRPIEPAPRHPRRPLVARGR